MPYFLFLEYVRLYQYYVILLIPGVMYGSVGIMSCFSFLKVCMALSILCRTSNFWTLVIVPYFLFLDVCIALSVLCHTSCSCGYVRLSVFCHTSHSWRYLRLSILYHASNSWRYMTLCCYCVILLIPGGI